MDSLNKKSLILSVFVMSLGLVMLFGTSYSIITKSYITDNSYSLTVGNISVNFGEKENKFTLSNAYPISDKEALETGSEFSFSVNNLGDYTANYSLSIEEESSNKVGEVIRFSYNLNENGYKNISTLDENNIIGQNMILEAEKVDNYKIKFWIKEDANASYMGKVFSAKLVLNTTQNDYKYASSVVELLGNNNLDGVVGISHNGKISTTNIREYRYVGNNPVNYLWFNCNEGYTKGENHCEKWRIIGSFDNTWENGTGIYKTLKIVRSNVIENIKYSTDNSLNNHSDSYLNYYANNTYYNDLTLSAKNMILNAKWNIGKTNNLVNASESYNKEILEFTYNDIGTISPSDYGYASGHDNYDKTLNNQINNWLYQKNIITLNQSNNGNIYVLDTSENSYSIIEGNNSLEYAFLPTVYLKPDVSIISGYGTIDEPYEIDIKFSMTYGTVDTID